MVKYLRFSKDELYRFAVEAFVRVGVPREDAEVVADHLVTANLRGVDSHGVIRVPYYVDGVEKGLISPVTKLTTVKEGPFYALLDGGNGFCIVAAYRATMIAIEKAKNVSLGFVGVKNLGHAGMLAYYTKMIAREGMIGFACANGPARVAPWGGAEAVFGTNPISYAFPLEGAEPIVFDAATSAIASFKIRLAAMRSEKIPEGVALDKDGGPTTDPEKALQGVLLPFGGYKG